MTSYGAGKERPILSVQASTKLIEATRVPTSVELDYLSQAISNENRTVEIKFISTPFNAQVFGAEPNDFRCLPSGYMVNIRENSERYPSVFKKVSAEIAQCSLIELCSKIGIDSPQIEAVLCTQDKNLPSNKGVFVDIDTMTKLCAAAAQKIG